MTLKFLPALGLAVAATLFGAGTASAQFAPVARPGYMPNPFRYQRSQYNRVAPRWNYPVRPYVNPNIYRNPYGYGTAYPVPVPVYVPGGGTTVINNTASGSGTTPAQDATGTANLRITLPAEGASISVNGSDFGTGVGYDRNLTVPFVEDGRSHDYKVTATWKKDGKDVTETRTVTVKTSGNALANFLIPGK